MSYEIKYALEDDGRIIAEVLDLPGVMVYGSTFEEAARKAIILAADVLRDRE